MPPAGPAQLVLNNNLDSRRRPGGGRVRHLQPAGDLRVEHPLGLPHPRLAHLHFGQLRWPAPTPDQTSRPLPAHLPAQLRPVLRGQTNQPGHPMNRETHVRQRHQRQVTHPDVIAVVSRQHHVTGH
jgi:hypothetical protein